MSQLTSELGLFGQAGDGGSGSVGGGRRGRSRSRAGEAPDGDPLCGRAAPSQRHSAESKSAAKSLVARGDAGALRRLCLEVFEWRGPDGFTDEELYRYLKETGRIGPEREQNSIRPRRVELVDGGLVTKLTRDGRAIARKTRSGRLAQVWVITAGGRAEVHG